MGPPLMPTMPAKAPAITPVGGQEPQPGPLGGKTVAGSRVEEEGDAPGQHDRTEQSAQHEVRPVDGEARRPGRDQGGGYSRPQQGVPLHVSVAAIDKRSPDGGEAGYGHGGATGAVPVQADPLGEQGNDQGASAQAGKTTTKTGQQPGSGQFPSLAG